MQTNSCLGAVLEFMQVRLAWAAVNDDCHMVVAWEVISGTCFPTRVIQSFISLQHKWLSDNRFGAMQDM